MIGKGGAFIKDVRQKVCLWISFLQIWNKKPFMLVQTAMFIMLPSFQSKPFHDPKVQFHKTCISNQPYQRYNPNPPTFSSKPASLSPINPLQNGNSEPNQPAKKPASRTQNDHSKLPPITSPHATLVAHWDWGTPWPLAQSYLSDQAYYNIKSCVQ